MSIKTKLKKENVIFLVGPTAVGKTAVAYFLAKRLSACIISCDSMQVYKGMNILTSKSPLEVRRKIPHYLIDIVSPESEYSCADYAKDALKKIEYVLSLSKIPLVVGGSGLYVKTLIDGIFSGPSRDENLRKSLYKEIEEKGTGVLFERLKKLDPKTASRINPKDVRRIVRALEVYMLAKEPISDLKKETSGISEDYNIIIIGLNRERRDLYSRIDKRVDEMFRDGLVDEIKHLGKLRLSQSASQALGMKEVVGYLKGDYNINEAKRFLKRNTRHFAKRQLTWFRMDKRIKWFEIKEDEMPEKTADRVYGYLEDIIGKSGISCG
ncbi:MAG: tRNA (adenosine(37)-N6)-dimethylallyltransferase MiaA [Candidatus Omnitrophica bacterium]|nr:tRNA (adenosine(37)-N6)-dimethylallyltransferase MiaA [Candidatus Omnitrophota bacterium]